MNDTCPLRNKCYKTTQMAFSEIESFLDNSKKIKMNIVYYNTLLQEVFKNYVFTKNVSKDCDLIFTKLGNYYYFYNGILSNLDVFWKSSKTKARLANHITIGFDKRGWNIHETVYSTNITSKNLYYIIKKNSEIYYNIIRKGQFIKPVLKEMKSVLNTESIWNEIVCGTNVNNFGSKVAIKKGVRRRERK